MLRFLPQLVGPYLTSNWDHIADGQKNLRSIFDTQNVNS